MMSRKRRRQTDPSYRLTMAGSYLGGSGNGMRVRVSPLPSYRKKKKNEKTISIQYDKSGVEKISL
jgi:hypothetical protein